MHTRSGKRYLLYVQDARNLHVSRALALSCTELFCDKSISNVMHGLFSLKKGTLIYFIC